MTNESGGAEHSRGYSDGRLDALEARVDRHETSIGVALATINGKLDALKTSTDRGTGTASAAHFILSMAAVMASLASVSYSWLHH